MRLRLSNRNYCFAGRVNRPDRVDYSTVERTVGVRAHPVRVLPAARAPSLRGRAAIQAQPVLRRRHDAGALGWRGLRGRWPRRHAPRRERQRQRRPRHLTNSRRRGRGGCGGRARRRGAGRPVR